MKSKSMATALLLAVVIMVSAIARAEQPSPEVVKAFQRYNDADTTCIIEKLVPFIVPADLGVYQRAVVDAISYAIDQGAPVQTIEKHFGGATTIIELMAIDSASFYVRCNNWLMEVMPGLKEANRSSKTRLIGAINQTPEKVYIVFRSDMQVSGTPNSTVAAFIMRRYGSQWLVSLEGKTDKLASHVWRILMRQKK
jgi:hypothetical protein